MTMTSTAQRASVVLLVLAMLPASEVCAQRPGILEPNGTEVAKWFRTYGGPGGLTLSVLTQTDGPQKQQRMDEIADTLVAFAIGTPGMDARDAGMASNALSTLLMAGLGTGGVRGGHRPIPYAAAAELIRKIAEQSHDVSVRGSALSSLARLPDKAGLLPLLRKAATSQDLSAIRAITLLNEETGPEGREIARQLFQAGTVTQEAAREILNRLAALHSWPCPAYSIGDRRCPR